MTYDRKDPGQDPEYCDGLAPDDSADDTPDGHCLYCGWPIYGPDDYCSDFCRIDAAEDNKLV